MYVKSLARNRGIQIQIISLFLKVVGSQPHHLAESPGKFLRGSDASLSYFISLGEVWALALLKGSRVVLMLPEG